jgi:hypothetical protein
MRLPPDPNRTCSIEGCNKRARRRGWCNAHYHRWSSHGDPLGGGTATGAARNFLESVALPYEDDDCLIWPFGRIKNGYAYVKADGMMRPTHRVLCELAHGPSPSPHYEAAHSCGNGHLGCVNPRHVRWATHTENMHDAITHGTTTRGSKNPANKLDDNDVRRIRKLRGSASQRAIAAEYGVAQGTIHDIQRRRTWGWLE